MKNMLFMMVLFCVSSLAGQAQNVNANSLMIHCVVKRISC